MFAFYILSVVLFTDVVSGYYGNWNATHICCDETVHQRDLNSTIFCCGETIYDATSQVCCDTEVLDISADILSEDQTGEEDENRQRYYGCCGKTIFQYGDAMCCKDQLLSWNSSQRCCGQDLLYDTQTQFCSVEFDKKSQDITFEVVTSNNSHSDTCNGSQYDTETHACCSDQVVLKDESMREVLYPGCCGSGSSIKTYNYSTHVCCSNEELLKIPFDLDENDWAECCAGEIFTNHTWQLCCNDKIFDRPGKYQGQCCGSQLLSDDTTHFCCDDVMHPQPEGGQMGCCNDEVINMATQFCCGGPQTNADAKYLGCCSSNFKNRVYDIRTEKCGDNGVTQLTALEAERKSKIVDTIDPLCYRS